MLCNSPQPGALRRVRCGPAHAPPPPPPCRKLSSTAYGCVVVTRALGLPGHAHVAIKVSNLAARGRVAAHCECPLREEAMLRRLAHPHVVRLLRSDLRDGEHRMVLEYCAGGDLLNEVMARGCALAPQRAARLTRQLALAVGFLHRHGVVHHDIKPENVLLDGAGAAKLCDFGIARHVPDGGFPAGDPNRRPGTLPYAAPEYVAGEPYGRAADVYSVGVTAFVILFGFPPFEVSTDARGRAISKGRLRAMLRRWGVDGRVPDAAVDAVQRMLLPQAQRITADELLRHPWLAAVAESGPAAGA